MNEYGPDLARIHHEGFGDAARRAGPAIVARLRASGIARGLIVDLGCGSGILARYLLDRGYDVWGVDSSPAMVRLARRTAPAATFVRNRAEDAKLPECVAVVATGEAVTYVSGSLRPAVQLRDHIRRVADALVPGGLFVFDAMVEGASSLTYRTWRAGQGWAVLADVVEDKRRRVVRRRITTFTRAGSTYRRHDAEHLAGVYSRDLVVRDLRAHGFAVRTLRRDGTWSLPPRRLIFCARLACNKRPAARHA